MRTPSEFDWRDDNEARHLEKHGLTFDFAIGVFLDDNRLEEPDLREAYDPPRFNTVGAVDGICINVTFALKGDTAIILSARAANRKERKRHGTQNPG